MDRFLSCPGRPFGVVAVFCILLAGNLGATEPLTTLGHPRDDQPEGFSLSVAAHLAGGTGRTPFWVQSRQWGLYTDSALQASQSLEGIYRHQFGEHGELTALLDLDLFTDDDGLEPRLRFGYAALQWRELILKAGVFPELLGITPHPDLSSGSMAVSGNARPLPKVQISTDGFVSVPGTQEALQVKLGLNHGWYTGERYQGRELLHEKWAYARLGLPQEFGFYAGLIHHGTWGGDATSVDLDSYLRILRASGGGSDDLATFQKGNFGNNRGIWDIGVQAPFEDFRVDLYHHNFFEQNRDYKFRNGRDGLWGVALRLDRPGWWPTTFVVEHVRTSYQSGSYHTFRELYRDNEEHFKGDGIDDVTDDPGAIDVHRGRSSYYSHGIYRNGWSHQDRIIGNPFIMGTGSGEDFRIASNRVRAGHYGLGGAIDRHVQYHLLFSYVEHLSTEVSGSPRYAPRTIVPEGETWVQTHSYLGLTMARAFGKDSLTVSAGLGLDVGDVYDDALGMSLSLRWFFR
ncbi:Capsule assembly protein Wzi [Alkalispirochaeta americana]|uniref:Capsule assembly protein Wzi n=1 Tax=Alkalispirochaeta americana TaxID=159291 RepID=A0A1N6RTZ6_9SPIO|nr:capsule assembly Wzi family protein [Alkalispirochaeta americana]SIQ32259.1 Capsule assembly protein Wzi [Alkalispirochaeta americana]